MSRCLYNEIEKASDLKDVKITVKNSLNEDVMLIGDAISGELMYIWSHCGATGTMEEMHEFLMKYFPSFWRYWFDIFSEKCDEMVKNGPYKQMVNEYLHEEI